jgi:hypothetical protein
MFHAPEVTKFLRSGCENASVQGSVEDRQFWDNLMGELCEAEPNEFQ